METNIYIYIYIYISVCVCVCVQIVKICSSLLNNEKYIYAHTFLEWKYDNEKFGISDQDPYFHPHYVNQ